LQKKYETGRYMHFFHRSLDYNLIDLQKYCIEQEIEICAIKMVIAATDIYVISIYRSPTGDFVTFLQGIDEMPNQLYKPNIEIIICGDINMNYLDENCYKQSQLDMLLATYNLSSTV